MQRPKKGCSSGAVRKSPERVGRSWTGRVVAQAGLGQRTLHEAREGDATVGAPEDLVTDGLDQPGFTLVRAGLVSHAGRVGGDAGLRAGRAACPRR